MSKKKDTPQGVTPPVPTNKPYAGTTFPQASTKTKTVVSQSGAKVVLKAMRPSFEAAPVLPLIERWLSLQQRSAERSRSVFALLKQARDYNPDASKAYDNILSLGTSDYEVHVYLANQTDTDGEAIVDTDGEELLRPFMVRMCSEYSGAWDELTGPADNNYPGLNTAIKMALGSLMTYGGACFEVELNEALDDIVDVYPVDATQIDFMMDPVTFRFVPGLMIQKYFTPLDPVRFRYVGKDPDPMLPAGRSPLLAILDTVFFQQQFLRELQAFSHFANNPRIDVKVIEAMAIEAIQETRPDLLEAGNQDALQQYLDGFLSDIQVQVQSLQADDALVHWDSVEANHIAPGGQGIPAKELFEIISLMMVSGTKQLPMLLGRTEGSTTTHATVQWQIFLEQIKDYQRCVQGLITWALNLYLRIKGVQSYATLTFNPHKTSDKLLDAQTLNININSFDTAVNNGWVTDDQAAVALFGHVAQGERKELAPAPPPESPPRSTPDHDHRMPNVNVAQYPGWLQRATHETMQDYQRWRGTQLSPKFSQAAAAIVSNQTALNKMSLENAGRWLYGQLNLDNSDRDVLKERLFEAGKRATELSIEEQLRAVRQPKRIKLGDQNLLSGIKDQVQTDAQSIIDTYNDDLYTATMTQVLGQNRAASDVVGAIHAALNNLVQWEAFRNSWKEAQVSLYETVTNVMAGIRAFFSHNEVSGQAEVYPYDAAESVCKDYVAANPYPDMATLLSQTTLPAHGNCPHYGRLISSGEVTGDLWTGE